LANVTFLVYFEKNNGPKNAAVFPFTHAIGLFLVNKYGFDSRKKEAGKATCSFDTKMPIHAREN
jgi:hypothetical protein